MNLTESSIVACSAPGKVLLAGGYLVLDRLHTGLVFGLDARIHVLVQSFPESEGLTYSDIIVKSPQFKDAEWRYQYKDNESGGVSVTQVKGCVLSNARYRFLELLQTVSTANWHVLTVH